MDFGAPGWYAGAVRRGLQLAGTHEGVTMTHAAMTSGQGAVSLEPGKPTPMGSTPDPGELRGVLVVGE